MSGEGNKVTENTVPNLIYEEDKDTDLPQAVLEKWSEVCILKTSGRQRPEIECTTTESTEGLRGKETSSASLGMAKSEQVKQRSDTWKL